MKRAVFYGRVSKPSELQLAAMMNQMEWYDDFAKKNEDKFDFLKTNDEKVVIYDDAGKTGTKIQGRENFQRMLNDAESGLFDYVITTEVSRLARNIKDFSTTIQHLKDIGVGVYFAIGDLDSLNPSDFTIIGILAVIAQAESKTTSQRVKRGLSIAVGKGEKTWSNGRILGYYRDTQKPYAYHIDPEQAQTVRLIVDMYISGRSLTDIKLELEKKNRLTACGGKLWYLSTIARILSNPFYIGQQRLHMTDHTIFEKIKKIPKDEWLYTPTHVAPLITDEEWHLIQKRKSESSIRIGERTRPKKPNRFFYSKKLICACGSTYSGYVWRKEANGTVTYGYRCNNQKSNRSKSAREKLKLDTENACDIASIPEWKLDFMSKMVFEKVWKNTSAVEEAFKIIKDCYKMKLSGVEGQVAILNTSIKKLQEQTERIKKLFIRGDISETEYEALKTNVETDLNNSIKQKEELIHSDDTVENLDQTLNRIKEAMETEIDTSGVKVSSAILDKFIDFIYHVDDDTYEYFLNFDDKKDISIPEEYKYKIIKKNYFIPQTIIKDKRKLIFKTTITFDDIKDYKKQLGTYARKTRWRDITLSVYA